MASKSLCSDEALFHLLPLGMVTLGNQLYLFKIQGFMARRGFPELCERTRAKTTR